MPLRPKWTPADRLAVVVYELYEASLCPDCAQRRDRSYNPELSEDWQVQPIRCYACQALEEARSKQKDQKGLKNFVLDPGREAEPYTPTLTPMDPDEYAELTR